MAEVIIHRKWAEMIRNVCKAQKDCPGCPYEVTCDAVCEEDDGLPPTSWDLDIMQDEAEGGVFAEYDE